MVSLGLIAGYLDECFVIGCGQEDKSFSRIVRTQVSWLITSEVCLGTYERLRSRNETTKPRENRVVWA